jgi:hypothetical protein
MLELDAAGAAQGPMRYVPWALGRHPRRRPEAAVAEPGKFSHGTVPGPAASARPVTATPTPNIRCVVSSTDAETAALGPATKVLFVVETRLRNQGAVFDGSGGFADVARADNNPETPQNLMPSAATARAVVWARSTGLAA